VSEVNQFKAYKDTIDYISQRVVKQKYNQNYDDKQRQSKRSSSAKIIPF